MGWVNLVRVFIISGTRAWPSDCQFSDLEVYDATKEGCEKYDLQRFYGLGTPEEKQIFKELVDGRTQARILLP